MTGLEPSLLDRLLTSSTASVLAYGADMRSTLKLVRTRLADAVVFDARPGGSAYAGADLERFLADRPQLDAPLVLLLAEEVPDRLRAGLREALDSEIRVFALSPKTPPTSVASLFGTVVSVEGALRAPKL